jgi:nucleoside-diphosphate-sugar epimerase
MDTVVVTGAAGFMGTHLARSLALRGHTVRAVDVRARPAALDVAGLHYQQVDICDAAALRRVVAGADVVHHLASAHLEVQRPERHYRRVNVDAAVELVRSCAVSGVRRLVHTSTVGVYGHVRKPPADEDTPPAPQNTYERTKHEGERAVRAEAARLGLDVLVLQPAWVYGSGCPRLARLLRSVQRGRFVYVGAGRNLRHPIFIDDAVAAYVLAARAPAAASGRSYIIAGPRAVRLHELVEACARALDVAIPSFRLPRPAALAMGFAAELAFGVLRREPPFSRRSLAFFDNDNAFDTRAARAGLGFEPVVDLDEGLRRAAAVH